MLLSYRVSRQAPHVCRGTVLYSRLLASLHADSIIDSGIMKSEFSKHFGVQDNLLFANAGSHLTLPTYVDANNECTHPDVIDFGSGTTWNSYRYWMAMTPYTNGDNQYENPSILASNDNSTWVVPGALTNPIDPDPGAPTIWNADTDIVYDPVGDQLICYWKEQDSGRELNVCMRIVYMTSSDGETWSTRSEAITWTNIVSPAVVRRSATDWQMFSIHGDSTVQTNKMQLRTSTNGTTWAAPIDINWPFGEYVPWHVDVIWSDDLSQYLAVVAAWPRGSDHESSRLLFSSSPDGTNWKTGRLEIMNLGGASDWDNFKFYRTSLQNTDNKIKLWYSAQEDSATGDWHIGYTELAI